MNTPLVIRHEMDFIELIEEFGSVSLISSAQKLAKAKTYIGSEIEMTYKIINIEEQSIYVELKSGFEIDNVKYGSEEKQYQSVFLFYIGKEFGKQLLGYSAGDMVILKAKFQSVFCLKRLVLQFEMLSINKFYLSSGLNKIENEDFNRKLEQKKVEAL